MCHYILMTLPTTTETSALAEVLKRHDLLLETWSESRPFSNLKRERVYHATGQMCDCDTQLGAGHTRPSRQLGRDLAARRKRGWGEKRIERWLEQKRQSRDKAQRMAECACTGPWPQALRDILDTGATDWVGLCVHWIGDPAAPDAVTIPKDQISHALLYTMPRDVLHRFVA